MRLPLQHNLKTRQSNLNKDGLITNGFIEVHKSEKAYTIKRPGLSVVSEGTGTAHGAFFYDDILYVWDDGLSNTNPLKLYSYSGYKGFSRWSFWASSSSYTVNSNPVAYGDVNGSGELKTYYPMGPSTNIPPSNTGEGAILWSETNPGTTRWTGIFFGVSSGVQCGDALSAGLIAWKNSGYNAGCPGFGPNQQIYTYEGIQYSNFFFPFDYKYYIVISIDSCLGLPGYPIPPALAGNTSYVTQVA